VDETNAINIIEKGSFEDIEYVTENPGTQLTSSFHPVIGDWTWYTRTNVTIPQLFYEEIPFAVEEDVSHITGDEDYDDLKSDAEIERWEEIRNQRSNK